MYCSRLQSVPMDTRALVRLLSPLHGCAYTHTKRTRYRFENLSLRFADKAVVRLYRVVLVVVLVVALERGGGGHLSGKRVCVGLRLAPTISILSRWLAVAKRKKRLHRV